MFTVTIDIDSNCDLGIDAFDDSWGSSRYRKLRTSLFGYQVKIVTSEPSAGA